MSQLRKLKKLDAQAKITIFGPTVLVLISIATIAFQGLNLGLDFTGGALVEVEFSEPVAPQTVRMALEEAARSGALVVEAETIGYDYGGVPFIRDFSTTILRGDRVGIIGPNGVGKTTLLHILLGELKPHQGKVKLGTHLAVAYFDQMKAQLDEQATVIDNVAHGREKVDFNGRSKHIIGYLQDFLFAPVLGVQLSILEPGI